MRRIPPILKRPVPVIGQLARDRRGTSAILLALALSGIVGFAGLGSEVAGWYYTTRSMQSAADSAAESAAAALAAAQVRRERLNVPRQEISARTPRVPLLRHSVSRMAPAARR